MTPHSGELHANKGTGHRLPMVFNINAHVAERWWLSKRGVITKVETLVTDDGEPYLASPWQGLTYRLLNKWRRTNEYVFTRARGGVHK